MIDTRLQISLLDEIIVDNFAGGGGASTGIELATGRPVTIAINHDPDAILMHKTNHPYTMHYQESVWNIDPIKVCEGRHVGLAWFSPDCKHFSKAKGGKPVNKNIRGLAWIVLKWAGTVRPRVIILENVEEFKTWGPVRRGRPVKSKIGETFHRWLSQLRDLGYDVDYRELVAADYGAPTTRKRFFLIARCDGRPIIWPEPTYAPADHPDIKVGKKKVWRSAAEIIDWTIPAPSIFANKAEIKEQYGVSAVRPLARNTMRRVARGLDKFVLKSAKPFIVRCDHGGERFRGQSAEKPLATVTSKHGYGIAEPMIVPYTATNTSNSVGSASDQPINTVRTGGGGGQMLVTPILSALGQTGRQSDRGRSVTEPTHTQVSKAEELLITPTLIQYHTEKSEHVRGQGIKDPVMTVDAANRYGLVVGTLVKYYGNDQHGQSLDSPLHTITAKDREGVLAASLMKYFGGVTGTEMENPLPTITSKDHNALQVAHIAEFKGQDKGQAADRPLRTITASIGEFAVVHSTIQQYREDNNFGRWPQIRELLNEYCGYELADDEILLIWIGDTAYYLADIGLRMLTPRELYSANGFPPDYIIDRDYTGKAYGKSKQVARCGNAVPPPFATALVRANLPEWCSEEIRTMNDLEKIIAV
ncbi:MAG: DNA cytosine methyltransferase [Butyricicoccus sp.]